MTAKGPGTGVPGRRLAFTWLMLIALGIVGYVTQTYSDGLERGTRRLWGWAPADVALQELYRLITSAVITHGGPVFWQALIMVAAMVGSAEWHRGFRRTALTFWLGHAATLAVLAGLFRAQYALGLDPVDVWANVRDVGPSAGAFACLGLFVAGLPRRGRVRWLVGLTALGILAVDALYLPGAIPAETSADLAHLIAFPLGYASSMVRRRS